MRRICYYGVAAIAISRCAVRSANGNSTLHDFQPLAMFETIFGLDEEAASLDDCRC